MSNAPKYQGEGQPSLPQGSGSWLGQLGNLLGSGSGPTYVGTGQPVQPSAGLLARSRPAYRQDPAPQPAACSRDEEVTKPDGTSVVRATIVCPADCDPFAQGPIAIIVPRQD